MESIKIELFVQNKSVVFNAYVNDGYEDYMFVPAGEFQMGDNFGEGTSDELPVHTVNLDS